MERINYSRQSKFLMYFILILGIIALTAALFYIYHLLSSGSNMLTGRYVVTFFFIIALIIVGFSSIFVWIVNNKYRHFYIEWDDKKLRFRSPDSPQTQTIAIHDVIKASIQQQKLKLTLNDDSVKSLNLEGIGFEDLQKIKTQFIKEQCYS